MWRQAVEKILKDQYESALQQLSAIVADGSDQQPHSDNKCEAIIAKGKRENMKCNARAQPGTNRCKTHSKNRTASLATTSAIQEADLNAQNAILSSVLEPGVDFASRDDNGVIVFNVQNNVSESLF